MLDFKQSFYIAGTMEGKNEWFLRMCLNIITQIGPYLVVLLLLTYLVNLQQKRAKEREEEQKKGIIRTHYIIKTEKVLTMFLYWRCFFLGELR